MPVITSTRTPQVSDLAQRLAADLAAGTAARETFGARDVAFAWTTGLPSIIATAVNSALVEGLSFGAVLVSPSGTPAAKVAPAAPKPVAVTLTSKQVPLSKYAGIGQFTVEQALSTEQLVAAVNATLIGGALMAYDSDCWDAIDTAATPLPAAATWSEAILGGIAAVAGVGGSPDLLILSPGDYAAMVEGAAAGYTLSPVDAVPVLFGLRVVVSAGGDAGTAFVADSTAITAAENVNSPTVLVDPFSLSDTNEVRVVADLFAGIVVNSPAAVVAVSVTAAP